MGTRITISLPDDVAARVTVEPNQSAFIAALIRNRMHTETVRAALEGAGLAITDNGLTRARGLLRKAQTPRTHRASHAGLAALRARHDDTTTT